MYFWYYHHEAYSKVYGTVGMECTTKLYGIVGQMHRVPRFTFQKAYDTVPYPTVSRAASCATDEGGSNSQTSVD